MAKNDQERAIRRAHKSLNWILAMVTTACVGVVTFYLFSKIIGGTLFVLSMLAIMGLAIFMTVNTYGARMDAFDRCIYYLRSNYDKLDAWFYKLTPEQQDYVSKEYRTTMRMLESSIEDFEGMRDDVDEDNG